MKLSVSILLCFYFIHVQNSFAQTEINSEDIVNIESKALSKNKLSALTYYSYENIDIHYTRCEWKIDPAINYIEGSVTSYFEALSVLDSLTFDCSLYLNVDSVVFHSQQISFNHDSDLLKVFFPLQLLSTTHDSLSIFYHGVPNSTGNGSFEQGFHDGSPIIWTLSEPYGAKDWWPCRQNIADKLDSMDVLCQIPFGNKCASNGKLISVDTVNSGLLFSWKSRYPIAPYLVAIAVTNYGEFSDSVVLSNTDTLQILNYIFPEQIASVQSALGVTPSLIQFYDSLLIPYPFSKEKYGHAQFGWGGGMEHQTMSFVGTFGFELIAHELVHQWFGDEITCRSWSDIWLHEGFATYLAGMAIEKFQPSQYDGWKYTALQNIISKPNGSVYCNDTTDITRIFNGRLSYHKAAFVLHMLRWKFGDELFLLSLRNFLENNSLQYKYSETNDLKNSFEFVTSSNLTQYFDEWVYGEGYPSFDIEWSKNGNSVDMKVVQTTSDISVPFFHIPVPIQVGSTFGDTTLIIDAAYSGEQFHFDLAFKPEFINIDPEIKIISGNNRTLEDLPPGSIEDLIAVFPNPNTGKIEVFAKRNSLKMVAFSVLDYGGKRLYSGRFQDGFREIIDLSSFSNGLYVLEIETDQGWFHKKIILQK